MQTQRKHSISSVMLRGTLFALMMLVGLLLLVQTAPAETEPVQTASAAEEQSNSNDVITINVTGVIDAVTSDFIKKSIDEAEKSGAVALVIELDTPGGLDASMRSITGEILNSNVPVITYVSPRGARATSAGLFIGLSSHVFAMAPGTHTGAAHPVSFGGDIPKEQEKKIVNDSVAYIRNLASEHDRNADWAEDAVRESVSITAEAAVELQVADFTATDLMELLENAHDSTVQLNGKDHVLQLYGGTITERNMTFIERVLHTIADPNIAYLLIILGFYGILFELSAPGLGFGGIGGTISLLLGLYAMQVLPVNYAGLALLILAFALFIADFFSPSHGILTGGGVVAMIAGSLLLFDAPRSELGVSIWVIAPTVLFTILFFVFVLSLGLKIQGKKVSTGSEGLLGDTGVAMTDISDKEGTVMLQGELWQAYTKKGELIEAGDDIEVLKVKGLRVEVKRST